MDPRIRGRSRGRIRVRGMMNMTRVRGSRGPQGLDQDLVEMSLSTSTSSPPPRSNRSTERVEIAIASLIKTDTVHDHITSNCQVIVKKMNPKCGHFVDIVCSADTFPPCSTIVEIKRQAYCGHKAKTECHLSFVMSDSELVRFCEEACDIPLACGHNCTGSCNGCRLGQFHTRCTNVCNKVLFCGHRCSAPCHDVCPPCWESCDEVCFHQKCANPCGIPCKKCESPCIATCDHSKCTKLCGDVCNRKEPCSKPCKIDGCVGLCGEPCPPLTLEHDKEQLIEALLSSKFQLAESDRFVYLPNCKHTIHVDTMDNWVKTSAQNNEIIPKTCPICRCSFGSHPRYQAQINEYKAELNKIKLNIIGDYEVVREIQSETLRRVNEVFYKDAKFTEFRFFIMTHLLIDPHNSSSLLPGGKVSIQDLLPMDIHRAKCVDYVSQIWKNFEDEIIYFEPNLEHIDFLVIHQEIVYIIDVLLDIQIPYTAQEYVDIDQEMNRFADICNLYLRRHPVASHTAAYLSNYGEAKVLFDKIARFVLRVGPYTREKQIEYNKSLKKLDEMLKIKLPITEEERVDILKGLSDNGTSGVGRWFKCQNGHYYVITECGGPTQLAKCPDCGLDIGGEQHRIAKGNQLAPEMIRNYKKRKKSRMAQIMTKIIRQKGQLILIINLQDGAKGPLYPTVFDPNPDLF